MVGVYHHRSHCSDSLILAWSLNADSPRGSQSLRSSLVVGHNYFILNHGFVQHSANMVSFRPTPSIFTQARRSGSFTKLWRMLYVTLTHFTQFVTIIGTIWSILISSNLPFMEQYLKLNYIPNKKCSAGQSWSVCNKASLLLKNTLYGHMKTLMKISTQENNPVTFPFRFKIITTKINLSILFYFHPKTERNWHSN